MRWLLALLLGCPPATDTGSPPDSDQPDSGQPDSGQLDSGQCRSDADCEDGRSCFDADDPFCGDCQPAERGCEQDPDCEPGGVCAEYTPACSCGDGPSSACVPACTDDAGCAEAEQCDISTGHCVVWSCTDGYTCPTWYSCTTDTEGTGCVRDTCSADLDCAGGFCVDGRCFGELGFCSYEPP